MSEISEEQKFRLDLVKQVSAISAQLDSLVKSNDRQNELFDEHRSNIRQALSDHAESVDNKLDKITEEQKKLRTFVDRCVGICAFLIFTVPTVLTFLEVNHIVTSQVPIASETRQH